MLARFIISLFLCFVLVGCTTNYYVCEISKPEVLYTKNLSVNNSYSIPSESKLLLKKKYKKKRTKHYVVTVSGQKGYLYNPSFKYYRPYNYSLDGSLNNFFTYTTSSETRYSTKNKSGSNTSHSNYNKSSSSGTVNVKGYYRKDGTYVKPHTRSAPRRR